jgi:predicted Zn-dependent protease
LNKRSEPALFALLSDKEYPAIVRASAMEEYGVFASSRIFSKLVDELNSEDPLIRLNAIKGLNNYPQQDIVSKLAPLLADEIVAVRMEAMNAIAPSNNLLLAEEQQLFKKVMTEYVRVQERMSHRPEGFYNRAILYQATGDITNAEQLYKSCIKRFPSFGLAYSNLADLYRDQNKEQEARTILDNGLNQLAKNAQLHYALGLWLVRNKENKAGVNELKIAADLAPGDAQMIYGYSIALFSGEQKKDAIAFLEKYTAKHGNNAMILDALASMYRDINNNVKDTQYSEIRKEVFGY